MDECRAAPARPAARPAATARGAVQQAQRAPSPGRSRCRRECSACRRRSASRSPWGAARCRGCRCARGCTRCLVRWGGGAAEGGVGGRRPGDSRQQACGGSTDPPTMPRPACRAEAAPTWRAQLAEAAPGKVPACGEGWRRRVRCVGTPHVQPAPPVPMPHPPSALTCCRCTRNQDKDLRGRCT